MSFRTSHQDLKLMQSVFRTRPSTKKTSVALTNRPFHPRKTHTKSRQGCTACKERRKKCDESHPTCKNCSLSHLDCSYTLANSQTSNVVTPPDTFAHQCSMLLLEDQIYSVLGETTNHKIPSQYRHEFQHFNQVTLYDLGMKTNQNLLASCVASGAWYSPAMMHLVLALSQLHLKSLHGFREDRVFAISWHLKVALRQYRLEIAKLKAESMEDAVPLDALVTSTYLLNVVVFAFDDGMPPSMAEHDAAIDHEVSPIASAGNLRSLMRILPGLQVRSSWKIILSAFAEPSPSFQIDELPAAFADLCALNASVTHAQDNLYYRMLCYIVPILHAKPCTRHIAKLFAMIGDLWADLGPKLVAHDDRALLLFAWWLTLLHRLDVWWVQGRARSACMAIVAYLSNANDRRLQALLAYPASLGTIDCAWIWSSTSLAVSRLQSG